MVSGIVTARREAIARIQLHGFQKQMQQINVIVDTGFTGWLTLPIAVIDALELPAEGVTDMKLADDSIVQATVHQGFILWKGRKQWIRIHHAEGNPLLGMSLIFGNRLTLDGMENGPMTIVPLN